MDIIRFHKQFDVSLCEKFGDDYLECFDNYVWAPFVITPMTFYEFGLPLDSVGMLAYLINQAKMKRHDEKTTVFLDNYGWFGCGAASLRTKFKMTEHTQRRIMNDLIEAGFVSTQMRGIGKYKRRWIFIHIARVIQKDREVRDLDNYFLQYLENTEDAECEAT